MPRKADVDWEAAGVRKVPTGDIAMMVGSAQTHSPKLRRRSMGVRLKRDTLHSSFHVRIADGVGFGSAHAIAISYAANHSILWAIIHGILGWLYVI